MYEKQKSNNTFQDCDSGLLSQLDVLDVKPEVSDHFWLVAKTFLGYWNKIG